MLKVRFDGIERKIVDLLEGGGEVPFSEIYSKVWGDESRHPNTLPVYICRIRAKLPWDHRLVRVVYSEKKGDHAYRLEKI